MENNAQATASQDTHGVSLGWICASIDKIIGDNKHIREFFITVCEENSISKLPHMTEVIMQREEPNRKTLDLLEKMYEDIKPKKRVNFLKSLDPGTMGVLGITNKVKEMCPTELISFLNELAGAE